MHASVFNRLTIRYVEISSGADYNPNMENNKSAKYFQNWEKKVGDHCCFIYNADGQNHLLDFFLVGLVLRIQS